MSPSKQELNRMLDHVRKEVFLGNNAAFLGSILCSVEFFWDEQKPDTVWTDGVKLGWGPKDFLDCNFEERRSTLLHELWHVARLHMLRRGDRDPQIWNVACDYRINNDLRRDGFFIPDTWVVDPSIDADGIMTEEDIYDLLMKKTLPMPPQPMGDLQSPEDVGALSPVVRNQVIASVVRAVQAAEMAGKAGLLPGDIKKVLNTFLEPVINWKAVLMQWMTDLSDSYIYNWKKPNRRSQSQGLHLPSRIRNKNKLEHLVYFQDTSGSISEKDMNRFNSEVKYIQEVMRPQKLTLVQFDTKIQYTRVFEEHDPFEKLEMHGGGGTDLEPVRKWIEENQPTAAVIFSDLQCEPMLPLSQDIPVIWAVVNNPKAKVPFGKMIHIKD